MQIKVWLQETADIPQNIEGYICDHSFDEEEQKTVFFSSLNGQETFLSIQDITQLTQTDFSQVIQHVNTQKTNILEYIEQLEHPLIRYAIQYIFEQKSHKNTDNRLPDKQYIGAKVLLTANPQYHKNKEVTQSLNYIQNKAQKPIEDVARYLDFLSTHNILNFKDNPYLSDGLIICSDNIPQVYFEKQAQIAFEQGRGNIEITDQYKQILTRTIIGDQKKSLDRWTEYLSEQQYPEWYQLYVLDGLKKMGAYNKEKNRFSKRRKDYVGAFPELNREALAQVYDYLLKYHEGELSLDEIDKELLNLLKTGSFVRLYEYFLVNSKGIIAWDKEVTDGIWVKYEQTDDQAVGQKLAKSLEGYNTGWCTAGIETAQQQISRGDFYVYYSKNKLGITMVPRIAIRMEEDKVVEVRGIEDQQNLESNMSSITDQKVSQLPGGDQYFVKTVHMDELTSIWEQVQQGKDLDSMDLRFLYQIDEKIQGFGYEEDPRIEQLLNKRREQHTLKQDLAKALLISEEEILDENDISSLEHLTITGGEDLSPSYVYRANDHKTDIDHIKYFHGSVVVDVNGSLPDNIIVKETVHWDSHKPLPKNLRADWLTIRSNAYYSIDRPTEKGLIIPETIQINNITIKGQKVEQLPEQLKISGQINIVDSKIKQLPNIIECEDFILKDSEYTELPKKIKAEHINFEGLKIKTIDTELIGVKNLNINHSNITTLPENLSLHSLIANYSQLKTLPQNFQAQFIDIQQTNIEELPDGLVCGTLSIRNTKIKTLPKDIKIKNHLNAINSQLEILPDNLTIGSLNIRNTKVKQLPKNLQTSSLVLNSLVEEIPSCLKTSALDIRGTKIQNLPENLQVKKLLLDDNYKGNIPEGVGETCPISYIKI